MGPIAVLGLLAMGRETDLTISAVQALAPYIKPPQPYVYRESFLPQPVVRLTGERDEHGQLRDGFLTRSSTSPMSAASPGRPTSPPCSTSGSPILG